jgi:hypothetical protein
MWDKGEGEDVALNGNSPMVDFQQLALRLQKLNSRIDWVFIGENGAMLDVYDNRLE